MDHVQRRAAERSSLRPAEVEKIRKLINGSRGIIPKGHHFLSLRDGSYAVVKQVGNRHVLASILARNMIPPGVDMRSKLKTAGRVNDIVLKAYTELMARSPYAQELAGNLLDEAKFFQFTGGGLQSKYTLPLAATTALATVHGKQLTAAAKKQLLKGFSLKTVAEVEKNAGLLGEAFHGISSAAARLAAKPAVKGFATGVRHGVFDVANTVAQTAGHIQPNGIGLAAVGMTGVSQGLKAMREARLARNGAALSYADVGVHGFPTAVRKAPVAKIPYAHRAADYAASGLGHVSNFV